jgi:O-antigen/teichoic acid export membrane protein
VSGADTERFGLIGAGAAASLASRVVILGAGFLFTLLAVRLLPLGEYGILAAGLSVIGIGGAVAVLGIGPAVVREVAASKARGSDADVLRLARASLTTLAIMGLVASAGLAWLLLANDETIPRDVLLALSVGLSLLLFARATTGVSASFARAVGMMRLYTLISPMVSVVQLVAVAFLLVLEIRSLVGVAIALGLGGIVVIVTDGVLLRRRILGRSGWLRPDARQAWRLAVLAGPYALAGATLVIIDNLDVFVLSLTRTSAEVGLYQPALRVTTALVTFVPPLILTGFVPLATSLYVRGSLEEFRLLYSRTTKFIIVLSGPFFVLLAGAPDTVLSVLLGPRFAASGDVVRILLLGYAVNTVFGVNNAALIASAARRELAKVYGSSILLTGLLAAILIPRFGAVGAAWTTAAAIAYMNIFVGLVLKSRTGSHPLHRDIIVTASTLLLPVSFTYVVAMNTSSATSRIIAGIGLTMAWWGGLLLLRLVKVSEMRSLVPSRWLRSRP